MIAHCFLFIPKDCSKASYNSSLCFLVIFVDFLYFSFVIDLIRWAWSDRTNSKSLRFSTNPCKNTSISPSYWNPCNLDNLSWVWLISLSSSFSIPLKFSTLFPNTFCTKSSNIYLIFKFYKILCRVRDKWMHRFYQVLRPTQIWPTNVSLKVLVKKEKYKDLKAKFKKL